jgi:hypothetical protein
VRGLGTLVLGALAVGTLVSALQRPVPLEQGEPAAATVDVKVAVKTSKGCGPYLDSLSPLVSGANLQPGAVTPITVVCLRNQGGAKAIASMSAIELLGRDDACTGSESQVDATCGNGSTGELQNALVQEFALLDKCDATVTGFASTRFADLAETPLMVGPIGRNDTRCIALRLRYVHGPGVDAAQTDSVTWRYAFQLSG